MAGHGLSLLRNRGKLSSNQRNKKGSPVQLSCDTSARSCLRYTDSFTVKPAFLVPRHTCVQGPGLGQRLGRRAGLGVRLPPWGIISHQDRSQVSTHSVRKPRTTCRRAKRIRGRKWEEAGGSERREPGWSHTWEAGRPVQGEKEGPAAGIWPCPGTWSGLTAQRTVSAHRARVGRAGQRAGRIPCQVRLHLHVQ